ncbi:hypothetical protein H4R34_002839 [Dimargaris verticillata]|uniref:Exportin-4 n=1 Tax=Dimargaris verticillata TaxID=2761393 RepID=A0A9W8EDQ3_9FUNG|nr:hypothetical protein H4R34_002839 [Dimargaris verticillata]
MPTTTPALGLPSMSGNDERSTQLNLLEAACDQFNHPATHAAAEHTIAEFKRHPQALTNCQYVLAQSQHPTALFHALATVKEVALAQYAALSPAEIERVRDGLTDYLYSKPDWPHLVREQLTLVIALLTKRLWLDITDDAKRAFWAQLLRCITDGMWARIGLAVVNTVIEVFANRTPGVLGLPWEYHYQCKLLFEQHFLLDLYQAVLGLLHRHQIAFQRNPTQPEFQLALQVIEKLLTWPFSDPKTAATGPTGLVHATDVLILTSTAHISDAALLSEDADEQSDGIIAQPCYPTSWYPTLADAQTLALFFAFYPATLDHDSLALTLQQILFQLTALPRHMFDSPGEYMYHLTRLLSAHSAVLATLEATDWPMDRLTARVYGAAHMVACGLSYHSLSSLVALSTFSSYLTHTSRFTSHTQRLWASQVQVHQSMAGAPSFEINDAPWNDEHLDSLADAYDTLAGALADLVRQTTVHPDPSLVALPTYQPLFDTLNAIAAGLTQAYVETMLHASQWLALVEPDQADPAAGIAAPTNVRSIPWGKPWDPYVSESQLLSIGTFGRSSITSTLGTVGHNLHECGSTLLERRLLAPAAEVERLRWLILITGHILTDHGDGEMPLIPPSVLDCSTRCPLDSDLVLKTITAIMTLIEQLSNESVPQASKPQPYARLVEALFWFMARWVQSYLLAPEDDYTSFSANLAAAYGTDRQLQASDPLIHRVLELVATNGDRWRMDRSVVYQIIQVVLAIGRNRALKARLMTFSQFPEWLTSLISLVLRIPRLLRPLLCEALAQIALVKSHPAGMTQFLRSFQTQLLPVLDHPPGETDHLRPTVLSQVCDALDALYGLVQASDGANTGSLFAFFQPYLATTLQLLRLYWTQPPIVMRCLNVSWALCRCLDLALVSPEDQHTVCQCIATLFTTYHECHAAVDGSGAAVALQQAGPTFSSDSLQTSEHLVLLAQILSYIVNDQQRSLEKQDDFNLVLYTGLRVVTQLVDADLLAEPDVALAVLQLLSEVATRHLLAIATLPSNLLTQVARIVQAGLTHLMPQVSQHAYEILIGLAQSEHINALIQSRLSPALLKAVPAGTLLEMEQRSALHAFLCEFQPIVCDCLFFQPFDPHLITVAGRALIALIQCDGQQFQAVLASAVNQPSDPTTRNQLNASCQRFDIALSTALQSQHRQQDQILASFNHQLSRLGAQSGTLPRLGTYVTKLISSMALQEVSHWPVSAIRHPILQLLVETRGFFQQH